MRRSSQPGAHPRNSTSETAVDSASEFFTSWTFMIIMAGMLCFLLVLIPIGIILAIVFANRAQRENRQLLDRED
jgi:hypothetical protein